MTGCASSPARQPGGFLTYKTAIVAQSAGREEAKVNEEAR